MADIKVGEVAISLPFSINEFGSVSTSSSQEKIWQDRVRSAVGTAVGERLLRPDYGTEIPSTVLDNAEAAAELIKSQVELAFVRDLTLLKLDTVETSYSERTSALTVEIAYELPNRQTETVTLGFASLSGNLPITEDVA